MGRTLEEVMNALPDERREAIEKRGQELIGEQLTLQALRKKLNLTQEDMAKILDIKQANISKVEQRSDLLISTLRSHIEAMGGTLDLIAQIPGRPPVKLEGFQDLSNH